MWSIDRSPKILRSMCVVPYLDLHYAHVVEPLYSVRKKRRKFTWESVHTEATKKLKGMLMATPTLRKASYKEGIPIYVIVDTSPTGIG